MKAKNMSFFHFIGSYISCVKEYWYFLRLFRNKYKNYLYVAWKIYRNGYPIVARLKNNTKIAFHSYNEIYNNLMNFSYDSKKEILYVDGLKFHGAKDNGDIASIFIKNEYKSLPVKGRVVIDIGANIADSSIFFAMQGAKRVIAIEPSRENFEIGIENAEENNFSDRIHLIWASCTSSTFSDQNKDKDQTLAAPLTTIQDIVDNVDEEPPYILKVDCEGCEYEIILDCHDKTLRKFNYIQIEYHYGYRNLKEKLENSGFHVTLVSPKYFLPINKNPSTLLFSRGRAVRQYRPMFIGWLYAEQK
jgi:FkbM family methyltransferase